HRRACRFRPDLGFHLHRRLHQPFPSSSSSSGGIGGRSMPKIAEAFFWISMRNSARSSRRRNLAFSRRSRAASISAADLPLRPRLLPKACNVPSRLCLRQSVRWDEYRPSRRRRAPTSPELLHASASFSIRDLKLALNLRRRAFSRTSGVGTEPPELGELSA